MNQKSVNQTIVTARKFLSSANYFVSENNLEESKKYLEAALIACQVVLTQVNCLENERVDA